jgi:hypothetical protein
MPSVEKLDLYKQCKADYATPKKPVLLTIRPAQYLTFDGRSRPGPETMTGAFGAIYGAAFTIKMKKKREGRDYAVCKMEGQYWNMRGGEPGAPGVCDWKLMIRTPDFVKAADLKAAVDELKKKGKGAEVDKLRLETIDEGRCVQMLHVGPYDREAATIGAMKAFAKERGVKFYGRHHEIYLSDPRRVAPEKLRTILRQPVK